MKVTVSLFELLLYAEILCILKASEVLPALLRTACLLWLAKVVLGQTVNLFPPDGELVTSPITYITEAAYGVSQVGNL